jgi:hypothetical protein
VGHEQRLMGFFAQKKFKSAAKCKFCSTFFIKNQFLSVKGLFFRAPCLPLRGHKNTFFIFKTIFYD